MLHSMVFVSGSIFFYSLCLIVSGCESSSLDAFRLSMRVACEQLTIEKWLKFNLNPHWNYSRTDAIVQTFQFKGNQPLQHLVIEMNVHVHAIGTHTHPMSSRKLKWEKMLQTLLFPIYSLLTLALSENFVSVARSNKCKATTDVLHKIIVMYVCQYPVERDKVTHCAVRKWIEQTWTCI